MRRRRLKKDQTRRDARTEEVRGGQQPGKGIGGFSPDERPDLRGSSSPALGSSSLVSLSGSLNPATCVH